MGNSPDHILVHWWLGPCSEANQGPAERVPARLRLGARVPPPRRRHISPPNAEGWREVLHRQAERTPAEHAATFKPPHRRRITEALRG